jgi:beta-lactamase regulating signal transducer with metallopeptidase domain
MTAWLLTWLWQGLALTLLVAGTLRLFRRPNAATRHLVWLGVLIALAWMGWAMSPYGGLTAEATPGADPIDISEPVFRVEAAPDWLLSVFLGIWAGVALLKLVRLVPGLHTVYSLRDCCTPFPSDLEARLPLWLEGKRCGRPTQLMICNAVPGATVLGFQRPCIVLPGSMVDALSIDELDQVIFHEYAHVQRRDDWLRLAQALLHPALWIHPAAALVGRWLDLEREIACDEWVVARTGLPKKYARCLARAAELTRGSSADLLLVPTLFGGSQDLVRRVDRLLSTKCTARRTVSLVPAVASACAVMIASALLPAIPLIGEMAAVALPGVTAPAVWASALKPVDIPASIDESTTDSMLRSGRKMTDVVPLSAIARSTHVSSGQTQQHPESGPNAVKPHAELERGTSFGEGEYPPIIEARVFDGTYQHTPPTPLRTSTPERPWQRAATAGARAGDTAQRASVSLASAFTRAGVSLARKF